MTSENLVGGLANAGRVVRHGDTVRRPSPPHAPSIHRLLRHLASHEFGAPRPQGVDGDGYEIVAYVPGDVAVTPYPQWASSDEALSSVARLLRRYHESVVDFDVPAAAAWSDELADPAGGPLICHNAYGLSAQERALFPDVLLEAEDVAVRFVTGRVERGDVAFVAAWDTAAERRYEQKMSWLHRNLRRLRRPWAEPAEAAGWMTLGGRVFGHRRPTVQHL